MWKQEEVSQDCGEETEGGLVMRRGDWEEAEEARGGSGNSGEVERRLKRLWVAAWRLRF